MDQQYPTQYDKQHNYSKKERNINASVQEGKMITWQQRYRDMRCFCSLSGKTLITLANLLGRPPHALPFVCNPFLKKNYMTIWTLTTYIYFLLNSDIHFPWLGGRGVKPFH